MPKHRWKEDERREGIVEAALEEDLLQITVPQDYIAHNSQSSAGSMVRNLFEFLGHRHSDTPKVGEREARRLYRNSIAFILST